ncbi:MAG: glutamate--tRNA ligase [Patescibacteria group bacterium]|nr:glutamate--tRNA ligase [Patescibacteria group bacterium]
MPTTRFAPSPTGYLHIGGLRTALFAYLFARKQGGKIILRIEDTDQKRYVQGATENLIKTLSWFGIEFDEGPYLEGEEIKEKGENGPYFQSKRTEIYKEHAQKLLDEGHAYYCFCTPERLQEMREQQQKEKKPPMYDRKCCSLTPEEVKSRLEAGERAVIRQKIPHDKLIEFTDSIRDEMSFDPKTIDDQVLIKSEGFPTYHLANVVDDHFMGITHVIRGEEWLPSTPKHIALYQAFGWEIPQFAHIPLLLNLDKSKLSKRQGDVAAEDYINKGYLREAILNFIAFLGWNPGTEEEFFSLEQLIEKFDLKRVQKAGAIFNLEKLDWFNGHYLREKSVAELADLVFPLIDFDVKKDDPYFLKSVEVIQTRLTKLEEAPEMLRFFFTEPSYEEELLLNPKMKVTKETAKLAFQKSIETLEKISAEDFEDEENLKQPLLDLAKELELKNGQILWPLRVALTGEKYSPGTFEVLAALGKEKSVERIQSYLTNL